jgi:tight adherence protein B
MILMSIFVIILTLKEIIYLMMHGELPERKSLIKRLKELNQHAFQKTADRKKYSQFFFPDENETKAVKYIKLTFLPLLFTFLSYLLIQNLFYALFFGVFGFFYPQILYRRKLQKLKEVMILEFRDSILSIANSLKAGSSLQTAFTRCEADMEKIVRGKRESPMLVELQKINKQFNLGQSVDKVLLSFAQSAKLEDIDQFVSACLITKEKGGNLAEVIQNIAVTISDKISIQQEIKVSTSQKRMEASILTFMPIVLISVILLVNPSYMKPMYSSFIGSTMLFIGTCFLILNYFIARKIMKIDI